MQTVELLLDAAADAAVRCEWDALAAAGLPSQALHTGPTNAPHVTLAVAREVPPAVEAALPAAVDGLPVAGALGALVVFGSRRVALARLVVPHPDLLALHARVAALLRDCPGVPGYVLPGAWTPHVTLARGLTPGQVGSALEVLGHLDGIDGTLVTARRWDGEAREARPLA